MNEQICNKSQKTQDRIVIIENDLRIHRKNVRLLRTNFKYHLGMNDSYAPRKIKFSYIPRCENNFRFTLENISKQILLLERELQVLIEYGA